MEASLRKGETEEKGGRKKGNYIKCQSFLRVCESLWEMKWLMLGISFPFERDKSCWHVWTETEGRLCARSWDSCLEVCESLGSFYVDC